MSQDAADRVLATVSRFGVNHIDTAASYGDSELRLAPWLRTHRPEVFLATKTDARSRSGARRQLEESLQRLEVDQVDLIQLHNLVEPDEWEQAHAPGGAVEALVQARDEGLVRFIGVTGHGLRIAAMHRASMERFDFDSVLLPYNFTLLRSHREPTASYRATVEALLEECAQRRVAVQTIKSVARRRWDAGPTDGRRFSWYEPLTDADAIDRAVRFVLGRPQLFLNTSSDARVLATTLAAAARVGAGDGTGTGAGTPSDADMQHDADTQGITALFDGATLDRI